MAIITFPETLTPEADAPAKSAEFDLEKCIDALARGDCTEDEFLCDTLDARSADANSAWNLLSIIDQRYRRGQLSPSIFHSLKSRITRRAVDSRRAGMTIDLFPVRPANSPAAAARTEILVPSTPQERKTPPVLQVGRVLRNRYAVKCLLGRGGRGDVYKATDASGGLPGESTRFVAIKVLRERTDRGTRDADGLRREFECTRRLSHPNIVRVYELEHDDGFAFYTMEFVDGEPLCDVIERARQKPLARDYAWALIRAIGSALAHAHFRNVVHGDVSSRNIMVTADGQVRILDFGSSVKSNTPSGTIAATPAYASCELLQGAAPQPADDLYALACLACELLCGEHPFQGRRATEARDLALRPRRPSALGISQWRTLEAGLAWSQQERAGNVRLWLAQLGLEPEPERLPDPHAEAPAAFLPTRHMVAAIALLLGAAVCGLVAWHGPRHQSPAPPPPPAAPRAAAAQVLQIEPGTSAPIDEGDDRPTPPVDTVSRDEVVPARTRTAARPSAPARTVVRFLYRRFVVRPGAHFAEIRLLRSHASSDSDGFVWWTMSATAQAGVDFVLQDRTPYNFAPGREFAALFVRLIANEARTQPAAFQVCMSPASAGATDADVLCSTVSLPATAR